MKCPKCQTDNPGTRQFCYECGAKLAQVCPQCGSENLPRDKFGGECGHTLGELAGAPRINFSEPQSYTPKFLVDKILKTRSSIEGERKLVTVLFADVADYTSIAEKLDPEEVHQIMDGCFKILAEQIYNNHGTINPFKESGVVGILGFPLPYEERARRVCCAALSIQNAISEYVKNKKKALGVDFKVRIGLSCTREVDGRVEDDLESDSANIKKAIDLACGLSRVAKPGEVLATRGISILAGTTIDFEYVGKVRVAGEEEPREVLRLLKIRDEKRKSETIVLAGHTRFVGRSREKETLLDIYEKVRRGSGQIVELVGGAGIGKSRLLHEFRKMLCKGDYSYFEGRCLHYGGSMPYLPMLDILKSYFDLREGDGEDVVKKKIEEKILVSGCTVNAFLPAFHEILSLRVEDEAYLKMEAMHRRERIFEAIRDLLTLEAQRKPVIVAFEDLHWIDKTSEMFLNYLAGSIDREPILLLLLYRPPYSPELSPEPYRSRILLDELSTDSRKELIQSLLQTDDVALELMEKVLSRAQGNPLFIEEVTHNLLENGVIQRDGRQCLLARGAVDIDLPDTIHEIIAARMNRAGESIKRMMQVASVMGKEFALRILQGMTGMKEELRSYLVSFEELAFLHERNFYPEIEYIFKHALIQEVAYNSLLSSKRRRIHGRIGRAIEALYGKNLEEYYELLAYHYSNSDEFEKAFQYLKLSGNKAIRKYSTWEAYRFYREAITMLKQLPATEQNKREQLEARLLISIPIFLLGYPEDSLQILQEGEGFAKELKDGRNLSILYSNLALYHSFRGEPLLGIRYTEGPFRDAEKAEDIELMAPVACQLCASYLHSGKHCELVDVASRVIALLEQTHRERDFFNTRYNVYSGLCGMSVFSHGMLGNFEEGKALYEKGLYFAQEANSVYAMGLVETYCGFSLDFMGEGETAVSHFERSIGYLEKAQAPMAFNAASAGLGYAYCLSGNLESAQKYIERGIKMLVERGSRLFFSFIHVLRSMVHFMGGDFQDAENFAKEALTVAQKYDQKDYEGISMIWLGRILGKEKRSPGVGADEYISQGMKICDELKLKPWSAQGYLFLGELYADRGQREKTLENLNKAEAMFQEMGMDYWLARAERVIENL